MQVWTLILKSNNLIHSIFTFETQEQALNYFFKCLNFRTGQDWHVFTSYHEIYQNLIRYGISRVWLRKVSTELYHRDFMIYLRQSELNPEDPSLFPQLNDLT